MSGTSTIENDRSAARSVTDASASRPTWTATSRSTTVRGLWHAEGGCRGPGRGGRWRSGAADAELRPRRCRPASTRFPRVLGPMRSADCSTSVRSKTSLLAGTLSCRPLGWVSGTVRTLERTWLIPPSQLISLVGISIWPPQSPPLDPPLATYVRRHHCCAIYDPDHPAPMTSSSQMTSSVTSPPTTCSAPTIDSVAALSRSNVSPTPGTGDLTMFFFVEFFAAFYRN